jgi:hypothetical protein
MNAAVLALGLYATRHSYLYVMRLLPFQMLKQFRPYVIDFYL